MLQDLMTLSDWQQSETGSRLFPSYDSVRWFTRKHHERLKAAGALARIGKTPCVIAPVFEQLVVDIARDQS